MSAREEGWGSLINARDAHYFRAGRSLCGRWASFGPPLHQFLASEWERLV